MVTLRPASQRGHANLGWLKTYYSFSFADYRDPAHMGFRCLKVLNEDMIEGGNGFELHEHRHMEIVTYIVQGTLRHQDSLKVEGLVREGEVQRISAGKGILHSEYNASDKEPLRLLQIWIEPEKAKAASRYDQASFDRMQKLNQWCLLCSPEGQSGSLTIRQNAFILATIMTPGQNLLYSLKAERHAWVQVVRGEAIFCNHPLKAGDGASFSLDNKPSGIMDFSAREETELLLFDLP